MRFEPPFELGKLGGKRLVRGKRVAKAQGKARTTKTLISIARGELRMLAAMMAPCSVKAYGIVRRPPWVLLAVTICDFKLRFSFR